MIVTLRVGRRNASTDTKSLRDKAQNFYSRNKIYFLSTRNKLSFTTNSVTMYIPLPGVSPHKLTFAPLLCIRFTINDIYH